ncbi:MAG: SMC-Scp complex subunit ScpB [Saprospirales bacterium]|nr:MAG: SMC-Scp complex subunit ScpB [Saprospirales bacterium]
MDKLDLYIESVIFSSEEPVGFDHLRKLFSSEFKTDIPTEQMEAALDRLMEKYENGDCAFSIVEMNNGYLFMSKPEYHHIISEHLKLSSRKKLTKTALETLAIVAYKQPVTRADISSIRGVSSDYIIQKLLEKELIAIAGRSEDVGRPLLYKTSERFLEYFGLRNIKDLPKLRELMPEKEGGSIGEPAPVEADVEKESKPGEHP